MLTDKKIGILGGGQLGKMLCQAASKWNLKISVLDQSADMPAADYCHRFVEGNFKSYKDVYAFGKSVDILTIEIEHVNLVALLELEREGTIVHPSPKALLNIIDKGLQKKFYADNNFPTAAFTLVESKKDLSEKIDRGIIRYPFIQKARKEGYDGRGVVAIHSSVDLHKLLDFPSVVEELVDIDKEISVITAQNGSGEIQSFNPVEMRFKTEANILDMLISPADITEQQSNTIVQIAEVLIQKLKITGLLSIEFFIDKKGHIFINEIAPRPHNSGHQTIESNVVSQYEQHLRAIMNWPLIKPTILKPAILLNVLGEADYTGEPIIRGRKEILSIEGVNMHWYGKKMTKPYRKMGHVTIMADTIAEAFDKAEIIKNTLKIMA